MRWNLGELPALCQWKMIARGFYVVGLEPGTMLPMGRGPLREKGALPMIDGQSRKDITIDFEVLDDLGQFDAIEAEARKVGG
jgi:hypothetical protein